MPTWGGILAELVESQKSSGTGHPDCDGIRRKYLAHLSKHTGRPIILYATKFTQAGHNVPPAWITINDEDLQGLMEVMHGLSGPNLDLILHSPGGSIEAAEAFVVYVRSKFSNVRVIVPQLAMSAAAMIACSANSIEMGKHSFLGPIDPQFILETPLGVRSVPAEAIREQFELAKTECGDASRLAAWLPMLGQYGPDLLIQCKDASDLSRKLVQGWLKSYMFKEQTNAAAKARKISGWLCRHGLFKSHGRHLPRAILKSHGLKVEFLERDEVFQDLVLSVFHATTHTFMYTPAVKIMENQDGKAFIKIFSFPQAAAQPTQEGGSR